MFAMKLYTFIGIILLLCGFSGAMYGLSLYDNSTIGIMAISLAVFWGNGFAFISKRKESKRMIVFK